MSPSPTVTPLYLDARGEPTYAIVHPAGAATSRDTAVLLCPPFGWDEVCSYRSRREWAEQLARAGYPTIRLSYPGTGDSGSFPRDPDRLEAWTAAVAAAAAHARGALGVRRVVAIGIELGGLLAYRATATGAAIDDLILWATPARGRALVRQLSAFSKLELAQVYEGLQPPPPLPAGELEAGGFLLSAQTVGALNGLALDELTLPPGAARRALLLDRDGIVLDPRLREQLERCDVDVSLGSGRGYSAMTGHPQQAKAPAKVIASVKAWLDAQAGPSVAPSSSRAKVSERAELELAGSGRITEATLTIEQPFGALTAILSEPLGQRVPGLCAVLLNAGAVRRIGPNRMWVEAARRWAAIGVPTVRLDLEGLGDSDGDPSPYAEDAGLYVPELVPQVFACLDALQQRGVADRFVLGGLCAGAYWSFHAALGDPRVIAALMVNPRALIWDPELLPARDAQGLASQLFAWSKLREQYSGARARRLALWLALAPKRRLARRAGAGGGLDELDAAVDRLGASGKHALFVFSEREPLVSELVSSGAMAKLERFENVTIERVSVRDHTFRPTDSQRSVHEALDRALARELGHASLEGPSPRDAAARA